MTTEGESAVYSDEFEVGKMQRSYHRATTDLEGYFQQCRNSYDDRRNEWAGKSRTRKKEGPRAFPWEGASDQETFLVEDKIGAYVALCMNALSRSHIRAYPVEVGDAPKAAVTSSFLKWMTTTGIPDFRHQMEIAANNLFEKQMCITYVGWEKQSRTFLQTLDMGQIEQSSPEFAEILQSEENDALIIEVLRQTYPKLTDRRGKKALKQLRSKGVAELPVSRNQVDRPFVETLLPDGEFFFPAYTLDPQDAPHCFRRRWMTAQQVIGAGTNNGWDKGWVDEIVANYRGTSGGQFDTDQNRQGVDGGAQRSNDELIEVVDVYERLIDKEDGSEGIYCTVMHPRYLATDGRPSEAKRELMNGMENYPVVVTQLSNTHKRLYEGQSLVDLLRGFQWQVKVERDSRVDRNSLATVPPFTHPIGRKPAKWRPGHGIPVARAGELTWMQAPAFNPGSVEIENTLMRQADALVGLDPNRPEGAQKQQFFVNKLLGHAQAVLKEAFKNFQRFGPDEVFFRVTGNPDPQTFTKGNPDEDFDITVSFDTQNSDPDTVQKKVEQTISLLQLDNNGRMDVDKILEFSLSSIDPSLADTVLKPAGQANADMVKDITEDLTKIYAGVEVGARPQGATVAEQVIQTYVQQPDIAERLQTDEAFAARFQTYVGQYQMIKQQQQNATIGRLGTAPADFQGTNV